MTLLCELGNASQETRLDGGTTRVAPVNKIGVAPLFFEVSRVILLCSDSHSGVNLTTDEKALLSESKTGS